MLEWSKAMKEIKQKPLEPVYTCVGPEFVLVEEWLAELRQVLAKQTDTMPEQTRFSFDDGDLDEALFACQSLSLFTSTQVVVLSDVWAATGAKGSSKAKYATDALESYLDDPVPQNVLVLTVAADKLDERKKLVKKLKKYSVIDCTVPKEAAGHKTVQAILKRSQISMADDALAELWRRGGSVSRCATEAEKLWTYTKGRTITYDDVRQLVATPAEDNIFEWIDGVVTGNADRSYRALEDLIRTGHDTFSLFGMMVRQLRIMWYAKTLGNKGYSPQQIASEAGAHPYAVQVAQRQASRVKSRDIESLLTVVADAEFAVKSGRRDTDFALDWVVAACLAKVHAHPARRA
ncbi:DNA polymerase III subunit delta [Alicyclobacillus ferrooxydans]|uniref:DNA polymerase III subunit delta n=1 Tax=Alicyclobacillus ferrooxydans TaxID=471514 RepID=UPI0006D59BC6|nr:DNA polymerase III subunit delta [Alicyclobacillus ferrooxydans]